MPNIVRPRNSPPATVKGKRPGHVLETVIANSALVAASSDAAVSTAALISVTGGDDTNTIKSLNDRLTALEALP